MKKFDKDVDIYEKIIELKLAMKNTNNIRLYKRYSVVLMHLQGFKNRCNLTIALVQEYIQKKFNINMCHSAIYVAMNRLNLSYTRPTYVLAKLKDYGV